MKNIIYRKVATILLSVIYSAFLVLTANSAILNNHYIYNTPSGYSFVNPEDSNNNNSLPIILITGGGGGESSGGRDGDSVSAARVPAKFSNATTNRIIRQLERGRVECSGVPNTYRVSCLATVFKKAAKEAKGPAYRTVRRELNKTARKLDRLAKRNVDKKSSKRTVSSGKIVPVKAAVVSKVNREANKIITETQTKLLRSSGSGERKVHFQRIAQAVGSTKVILRS